MPSTRRQKAKARKSREMDTVSDLDTSDIMLWDGNDNPIERELAIAFEQFSVQGDSPFQMNLYLNCLKRLTL